MAKVTVRIPTPLRPLVGGRAELNLEGDSVGEVLSALCAANADIREQLFDSEGRLRNFVNIYVNDCNVRDLEGEHTALIDGQQLSIVPSIAGGGAPIAGGGATVAAELTPGEIHRYVRHITMPEVGLAGQTKLKNASVILIGAGGLGSPAALYLAAAGVGRLGIVDHDAVDITNLQRQILHGTSSVGRSKLESARERLQDLNPEVKVETFDVKLTSENALDILRGFDIVVDGSDNFPTRYLVSDASVLLGIPSVYGAIFRFDGQASVFGMPGGPCYRCLFREPPPAELVPNCVEAGVLGVLPGIVGTIQATETVKLILGTGESLSGRLLLIDAMRMEFRSVLIQRDPECPACGKEPTITELIDYEAFCGLANAGTNGASDVPEIEVEELKAALDADEPLAILDVREPYEWVICNLGHLGARLIPEGELVARLNEIDPKVRLVVHCHSGGRSTKAVEFLRQAGYTNAFNLRGGISAWAERIDAGMATY